MKPLQTLYNLLMINQRIKNQHMRFLYLRDVWGMEQQTIADCEGLTQSAVSRGLHVARYSYSAKEIAVGTHLTFTAEEIQYVQFLPRAILSDVQVIAFINDILGIEVSHSFFQHFDHTVNMRITALSTLGVQQKFLVKKYERTQSRISMLVKRNEERVNKLQRPNRYDVEPIYKIKNPKSPNDFVIAGGSQ